jgi:DNA polymerase I
MSNYIPPILLVDCNYLCWRSFHALKSLRETGTCGPEIIFGFLRDILKLKQLHNSNRFVFCWDFGRPAREALLPTYKETRRKKRAEAPAAEQATHAQFQQACDRIRTDVIPGLGYGNNFFADGIEGDDWIARVCQTIPADLPKIIVGSDKDLYQMLGVPNTVVWIMQSETTYTKEKFQIEWECTPDLWPKVKALAGCGTDDVPGIDGVGEVTAVQYLTGKLNPKTKTYQKVHSQAADIIARNLPLVELPHPNTPTPGNYPNHNTPELWTFTIQRMGIKKLLDQVNSGPAFKGFGFANGA